MIRWRKGWATAALLALAYGIMEEGLGDNTLFNSNQGADGVLGAFGRFAGVNWVWSTGVLSFHVLYSIGLPLVLLGLALPATRGRPLLGRRGLALAFASVTATTSFETVIVFGRFHFWMGPYLLLGSLAAISALVATARTIPAEAWRPTRPVPSLGPSAGFALGFAVFPGLFLLEYGGADLWAPAAAVVALELVFLAGVSELLRRGIGRAQREYLLVHFALGFVVWQSVFGLLLTLGLPYNLPLVVLAVYFLWRLRRAYSPGGATRAVAVPVEATRVP